MRRAPLVCLRDVNKIYATGVQALKGLDLDLHGGQFLSLLGSSGCGKSSALRLIAGLADPSSGVITWREGVRPAVGFVFQEPNLMPWANVARNVWLPLRLQGMGFAASQRNIRSALERLGLGDFADAYPRDLSGGMKMRVSIARALITRPPLLLFDEPFAALDEITRFQLNDELLAIAADIKATIVFVTHSIFESVYLSSDIGVFSSRPGRIIETIANGAPLNRNRDFRATADFAAQCARVSRALDAAGAVGAR